MKTLTEINDRIKKGEAVVVRADEMPDRYDEDPQRAAREVDVVTSGTFGAMCSSGVFLNFGHADPPIKMGKVWLNDVEAYGGLAAVDCYLGATELSREHGIRYGGGHVIEDLVRRKPVTLKATAYGTDCYPRKYVETTLTLDDVNQAVMHNPRNAYQRYAAATNSTDTTLETYLGTLLPNYRNVNWAGTGALSPLNNDPAYETLGIGTRIFLGGAQGYVAGAGTQHSPKTHFGTLAVSGDLKQMDAEFVRGATYPGYGTTLYLGIGAAIPILNDRLAKSTACRHADISTMVLDYGIQELKRPTIANVTYEDLLAGSLSIAGKKAKTACLSSFKLAEKIMDRLKEWIEDREFTLTAPAERLPRDTVFSPMKLAERIPLADEAMTKKVICGRCGDSIDRIATVMVKAGVDQLPIVCDGNRLVGIVTSWDITRATAAKKKRLEDVMTKKVITSRAGETIDAVSRKLQKYNINATPVVDESGTLTGIITLSDINRIYTKRKKR